MFLGEVPDCKGILYVPDGEVPAAGAPPGGNEEKPPGKDLMLGLGVAPATGVGAPTAGLGVAPAPKVGDGVGEGVIPGGKLGGNPVPKGGEAVGLGDPNPPKGGVGKICPEDRGGVGTTSVGLGEGLRAIAGCSVGVGFGLTAGASAVWSEGFVLSNCIPAAVAPPTKTSPAAVFAQIGAVLSLVAKPCFWEPLRLGKATNSSAYCSKAVARSNNCSVVRRTTCPDSGVAKEPR